MKRGFFLMIVLCAAQLSFAQISAKLMRYMDVSDDQITFVYGGDIWIMSLEGGRPFSLPIHPGKRAGQNSPPMGSPLLIQPVIMGIRMFL